MSAFTGALTVTELDVDWRQWRLEQVLIYEVGALGSGRTIVVPTGFVTDGASVPRVLWALLPSWGTYSRAAVVHDLLCRLLSEDRPHAQARDRKTADAIFYEAMVVCGTGMTMRWIMWGAVRAYGMLARK